MHQSSDIVVSASVSVVKIFWGEWPVSVVTGRELAFCGFGFVPEFKLEEIAVAWTDTF
jgi:hypothetical protein